MYRNLLAEMARKSLSKRDIAKTLNREGRTVRNRFSGKAPFTIPEAFAIRDALFPGVSLEYLFEDYAPAPPPG